jgi:CMP/dCMP kinase
MTSRHPTMREVLGPALPARLDSGRPHAADRRVIAISRQPGARGGDVARALGRRLGLHVYDREIIHSIAEAARVSEHDVAFLDEKAHPPLTDWFRSMQPDALSSAAYFEQLVRLVRGFGRLGDSVILGRGAHLILGPGEAVRVRVVAPLHDRVSTVAERDGVDRPEAARRVALAEAEQRAFLARYFHVDPADQSLFDLVINTALLGVEGAVDLVSATLARLGERKSCAGEVLS